MLSKNVETFLGCEEEYTKAHMVVFGAPFDSTTSYRPGTRFASRTMRAESYGLETYSPYQDLDLCDTAIFDAGDIELPFGSPKRALNQIEEFILNIVADQKLPVMIGGEHLVTLGAIRALHKKYPDLAVIHFDAHADLRQDYLGEKLSHATVMRRAWEILGDQRIYQFGIRSGDREEFLWSRDHVFMQKFDFDGLSQVIDQLKDRPVYFTLDMDILDPSIFPGTGTPEAGGVMFLQLLEAILAVSQLNIVGCDLCELSPGYDQSGVSTAVACKTLREILLAVHAKKFISV